MSDWPDDAAVERARRAYVEFSGTASDPMRAALQAAGLPPSAWRPIESAPLAKMVLLWHPIWRHPFAGMRNSEGDAVWVDTCEPEAVGWQTFASHWQPLPALPGALQMTAPKPMSGEEAYRFFCDHGNDWDTLVAEISRRAVEAKP